MARKHRSRSRKKKTSTTLWWVMGGILLLTVGIIWGTRRTSARAVTPSGVEGAQVGDTAPDFSVPLLGGGTFTLSEHRGRPTVVFFMAYWCGTCLAEGRALAKLQAAYGDQVQIIAIDVDPSSTPEALAQFKRSAGNGDFFWAFDPGQWVAQTYQVRSLDTTVMVDANGVVVYRDEFPTPYRTLNQALQGIEQ